MFLKNIPPNKRTIFVAGGTGSGKSSFINYLLGHEFILKHNTRIDNVKDPAKAHSPIGPPGPCLPSALPDCPFEELEALELDENTCICELPHEIEPTNVDFIPAFKAFIDGRRAAHVQLIILTSHAEWQVKINTLFSPWLNHFYFLIGQIGFISVINNMLDSQFAMAYYQEEYKSAENQKQSQRPQKKSPAAVFFAAGDGDMGKQPLAISSAHDIIFKNMMSDNGDAFIWTEVNEPGCRDLVLAKLKHTFLQKSTDPAAQRGEFEETKMEFV